MKNLLLIAYYWPPAGGGGVQRWLKMSKYLHQFGWKLTVVTPHKTDGTITDNSLVKEVNPQIEEVRTPIWEPYGLFKKFTGKKKDAKVYSGFIDENKKPSLTKKISVFIRGNFFIPDARMFWKNTAIKHIEQYLKNNTADAIISTGPPHTTHLIAMAIAKKHKMPWITDFRDPWTNIDFYEQLNLSTWADNRHKRLEKKVLLKANKIVTVSWDWAKDFERISKRKDIEVITNGYDHQDFEQTTTPKLDTTFSITHIGSMNADRNPFVLWKALSEICKENETFKADLAIQLIGNVDISIINSIEENHLKKQLHKLDFMPHDQVIRKMQSSQILLLPINDTPNAKGVLPGKLYEYMGAKRPILAIGPKICDAQKIISESKAGKFFEYSDFTEVKQQIIAWYKEFKQENLHINAENTKKYQRKALAKQYCQLLDKLV